MNPAHTVRRLTAARLLLVLLLFCLGESLKAQEEQPPTSDVITGELLLQLGDGGPVNVKDLGISTEKVQQILEWLTAQTRLPTYGVTMKASGTVGEVAAQIHVELAVDVHTDDWVRVDAGFPSWTPLDFQYTPEDPSFEYLRDLDESNRLQFHLKGKGTHTLSMDLLGEVRDLEAERQRLKLSRPPKALPCDLELTFDQPVEDVISNSGNDSAQGTAKPQKTVTFWGLSPETEISWEQSAGTGDQSTVISAPEPASMTLDLTASNARLSCSQVINIADGAIDRLSVRLPPGFDEVAITGVDDDGSSVVASNDVSVIDGVDTASVVLTKPVRGRMELAFDLRRRATGKKETIVVSVPDIAGVPGQSATVTIQKPPGLQVDLPPAALTERARVEVQPDQRTEATAYRLLSTNARLLLDVSQQNSRFTVQPQLTFSTEDQIQPDSPRLLLQAQFSVNVSLGSINDLKINWKQFRSDGWVVFPGTVQLTQEDGPPRSLTPDQQGDDAIHLVLDNFYSGRFLVEFQAFRDLTAVDGSVRGAFHLPDVNTGTSHDTIVSLVESDTYSLLLTNAEDDRGFSRFQLRDRTASGDPNRVSTWLVRNSGSVVNVELSLQEQEVSSTAVVALDKQRDAIHVSTEININVRNRDVRELRFTAAGNVNPVLHLQGKSEALPRPRTDGDEFVWQLPEAIRGEHTVTLNYVWWTPDASDEIRLPLVLPSSGLSSLKIGTDVPDLIEVVSSEDIRPDHPFPFVGAWHSDQLLDSVLLKVPRGLRHRQVQEPSICMVKTQVGPVNVTTTTSVFYEGTPGRVVFNVPGDASITAMVNGQSVDAPKINVNESDTSELRQVAVPPEVTNGVTVSLTCQRPRGPHHHLMSTETPRYPRLVRAPEWLTTVWLVDGREDSRLVPLNSRQHSILGETIANAMHLTATDQISRSVDTALTGLPDSIRTRFWKQFDAVTVDRRPELAFIAGPQLHAIRVLIYSRALGWVVAAGLGVMFYTLLVSAGGNLKVVAAVVVPVCVLGWGLLPQQSMALLFPVVPALVVAVVAWLVRQLLQPSAAHRRSRQRRNTIFVATPLSHTSTPATDGSATDAPLSGV